MTPEQSKELLAVTDADKACLQAIQEHAYAADDGGAFVSDDALEILARHRQSSEGELVRVLREALLTFERCAYPVCTSINPRGHAWMPEKALDHALSVARTALSRLTTDDLKGRG